MVKYMRRSLLFYLIATMSNAVFASDTTTISYEGLGGDEDMHTYKGPGEARNIRMSGGCIFNFLLLKGEELSIRPDDISLDLGIVPPKNYRGNYGLSCLRDEKMKFFKDYYFTRVGMLGSPEMNLNQLKKLPDLNTNAILFNGKNWKGIGIVNDYTYIDFSDQVTNFCIFGAKQALCGDTTIQSSGSSQEHSSLPELIAKLKRIEFVDNALEENYVVAPVANEE